MIHKIITHPGQAHQDDLLAVSVMLAMYPEARVERRVPTPQELEDHNVACIDIGGQYDPALNNFDHHQWGSGSLAGESCPCAATLVVEHYTGLQRPSEHIPYDGELYNCFPALRFLDHIDNHGPYKTASKYVYVDPDRPKHTDAQIKGCASLLMDSFPMPMQFLLTAFQNWDTNESWLRPCLTLMGTDIINQAKAYTEAVARIEQEPPTLHPVHDVTGTRYIAVYDDELTFTERGVLTQYLKDKHRGVVVVASHDDRGPGWSCVQFDGDTTMDTRRVKDDERVLFAHASGFIMKTKNELSIEDVVGLIREAMGNH